MSRAPLTGALPLVVILDADAAGGRDLAELAAAATRGGATMLQVRGKALSASALADAVRRVIAAAAAPDVPVVVNDRLDVALACGAAGCHLGQDDFPIAEARRLAPPGFLIGGSAGTEDEARRAARAGAEYLGIGPIKGTRNKDDAGSPIGVDGFGKVRLAGALPAVAIGGVALADVPALMAAGASGVAVIGAVLGAKDVETATRRLREAVDR